MWTLVGEDGSHLAKSVYYSSCPADSSSWVYLSKSGEYKALTLNEESSVGKGWIFPIRSFTNIFLKAFFIHFKNDQ
jgi:hypothetical protein